MTQNHKSYMKREGLISNRKDKRQFIRLLLNSTRLSLLPAITTFFALKSEWLITLTTTTEFMLLLMSKK